MKYTLDAQNKKIGRVATQAAVYLMGKNKTDFTRNVVPNVVVEIKNASKVSIDSKKMSQKTHSRYSGWPGGLTREKMPRTIEKKGYSELFRLAVSGMLPKNKLRQKMLNNLIITE
jgi:large subunit ribosomal protein L13